MLARTLLFLLFGAATVFTATAQDYVPAYERDSTYYPDGGRDIVLVYFGASWCYPCQDPAVKTALEEAKVMLAERAEQQGSTFVAIGVALDQDLERGLAFLDEAGRFDEISIGRHYLNSLSLAHEWRAERREDATPGAPSIYVYERQVMMEDGISSGAPTYLAELIGIPEIVGWVEEGAPLE